MPAWGRSRLTRTLTKWLLAGACCVGVGSAAVVEGGGVAEGPGTGIFGMFSSAAAAFIALLLITNLIAAAFISRLIRAKRHARTAVENMSQGLGMFDAGGRLVFFNT